MEPKIQCDICEKTSEINYVPKTLRCGHSICSSCCQEVFDLKKLCSKCDAYSETYKSSKSPLVHNMLKTCINIVEISLATLKNIKKIGDESYDRKELEDNIEKLEEIRESYQIMGDNYFKESNIFSGNYYKNKNLYLMAEPKPTNYIQLDGFENRDYFMLEINCLLENKKTVYVCDIISEVDRENRHFYQWKYGKFDSTKDCIDIHCLSMYSAKENAACVRLQDLKRCLEFSDYRPFIDFGSGKMFFTLTNSSALTLQFLKLCTGENGQTIKGSTATFYCDEDDTCEEINLPEIRTKLDDTGRKLDDTGRKLDDAALSYCCFKWVTTENHITEYDLSNLKDNGTIFSKGDVIIQSYDNCIYVRKVIDESYSYKNVVAKLITKSELKDLKGLKDKKIDDCGISMHWFV